MKKIKDIKNIKKFLSLLSLAAFLPVLSVLFAAQAARAGDMYVELLTATVTLLEMETDDRGASFLKLLLPDNQTEVEVETVYNNPFYDERGNALSPGGFSERYLEKPITIDFVEYDSDPVRYLVYEARGGNR